MSYVYICHSVVNIAAASQVRDFLIDKGFDVWNYEVANSKGDRKPIDDCGAFVVLMSAQSYADSRVQQESQHAEYRKKNVVPVLLEGEVFPRYKRIPFVDMRRGAKPPDSLLALLGGALRGDEPGKLVPEDAEGEHSSGGYMTTLARPKELQKLAEAMRTGLTGKNSSQTAKKSSKKK
jgi:hypothetical protein